MQIPRLILFVVLFFISLAFVFAQDGKAPAPAEESKEQTELKAKAYVLLAEIANDAGSLRLAENRVFVFSSVGSLLWQKDEKAARQLFRAAADEFIRTQSIRRISLRNDPRRFDYWAIINNQLRRTLIYSIKPRDIRLALEILNQTRSPELQNAVQLYRQTLARTGRAPDPANFRETEKMNLENASYEIQLERELQKELDQNNSQVLADAVREAFGSEQNFGTILPGIDELNKKDHAAAQKLLDEFVDKLNDDDDFFPRLKIYLVYQLNERSLAANGKTSGKGGDAQNDDLKYDERKIRAIANREFEKLLAKEPPGNEYQFIENALSLKKILPARYAELRAKLAKIKVGKEWREDAETTDLLGSDPPLDQIVKNSAKLSAQSKSRYYQNAVSTLLAAGVSEEKIAQQLEMIPDEIDRTGAQDYLKTRLSESQSKKEDFEAARQSVLQINDEQERIVKTVSLAIAFYQKNTDESRKYAEELLGEALRLTNPNPATQTEVERLLPVIGGYATVNPPRAFALILPLLDKFNELISASILLSNYYDKTYPNVSENEIVFGSQDGYHMLKSGYSEIARKLATANFQRTAALADSFSRADARIIARLVIVESILE